MTGPLNQTSAFPTRLTDLLDTRICDLGLIFKESRWAHCQAKLKHELAKRDLNFSPSVYFGDEWYCPDKTIAISVPFYLAHPSLVELARFAKIEVEGNSVASFMRLLRHECGHALDHAYHLSDRTDWQETFGSPRRKYDPDGEIPSYDSKRFVSNILAGYAQTHPFEDFAETFAVWLLNNPKQITQYRRNPKISKKLNYFDRLTLEIQSLKPICTNRRPMTPAHQMRRKLRTYLENPRLN